MAKWEYTETELWRHGEDDIAMLHVFGLVSLGKTVLAFCEARYGSGGDSGCPHDIWMRRSTDGDFRSNLTRGGAMEPYTPTEAEAALAIRAAKLLGLDFAGVDVLFGKDGPIICEVNSNPHFKTTLECTGVNMADEIMQHIAGKLEKQ